MNNQNEFIDVEAEAIDDKNLNRAERLVGFVDRLFDRIRRAVRVVKNIVTAPFRAVKAAFNFVREILNPRNWSWMGMAAVAVIAVAAYTILILASAHTYEQKSAWKKMTGPGKNASLVEKRFHEVGKRTAYWNRESQVRKDPKDKIKASWKVLTLEEKPSAPARAGNALGRLFK